MSPQIKLLGQNATKDIGIGSLDLSVVDLINKLTS